jgi:pectinesterase
MKLKTLYFVLLPLLTLTVSAKNLFEKDLAKHYDIIVDAQGNGDFKTVQEAINAVPSFQEKETLIFIRKGMYKEKLVLEKDKINVTFIGEDPFNTILTYDDYASKKNENGTDIGTSGSYSFAIVGDHFKAKNITFENSAGPVGQAVAVKIEGDKAIFNNCRFLGFQDTLFTSSKGTKNYFKNCYIEGTTDFIFGYATVLFENCSIHSKKNSYITAASTPEDTTFGYVFKNCKLTADPNVTEVYLGRPWRPFAKTVFIACEMGKHIRAEGWHNWSKPEAEKTAFYAEYKCTGEGFQPEKRVIWSHQLTKSEAKKYTTKNILGKGLRATNAFWNVKN